MDERWKQAHHLLLLMFLLSNFMLVSGKNLSRTIAAEAEYEALKAIKLEFVDLRGVLSSWNFTNDAVCSSWAGIKCLNGRVIAIMLPWKGLEGRISDKIGLLRSLRHLSLHDNALTGPVPTSLGSLPELRGVFLFKNRFLGSIPPMFANCLNLQILDLSSNQINGTVPADLANCSRLSRLNLGFNRISGLVPVFLFQSLSLTFIDLQHNNISGEIEISSSMRSNISILEVLNLSRNQIVGSIPNEVVNMSKLKVLDLSENNLSGEIPMSLADMPNLSSLDVSYNNLSGTVPPLLATRFNLSSFIGNTHLCGFSSSVICPENLPHPSELKHHDRKLSTRDIILIASGAIVAVLLMLCCVFVCCLLGGNTASEGKTSKKRRRGLDLGGGDEVEGGEIGGKLVHFDGTIVFAADDLLCATAEIMGKGVYGTAYKATMGDCNQVAVKRLREKMTKARKEFEIEAAQLGRIRHPNVSPLRSYYIGPKGEKLLVYDYMLLGSLASFLHARGPETSIPWPTRMAIASGIARGLSYLHTEENIIHGNLTSSNILLDEQSNPMIADVGLPRLMTGAANTDAISTSGSMGYRAPELAKVKDPSTKSDVYSFGVVVLELLTGKSPSEVSEGLGFDLPQWVASIVKEEWTSEVFDVELMRDAPNIGEELLNVLKLALHCVDPTPEARPEAHQVLEKFEEIKLDSIGNATSVDEGEVVAAKSE